MTRSSRRWLTGWSRPTPSGTRMWSTTTSTASLSHPVGLRRKRTITPRHGPRAWQPAPLNVACLSLIYGKKSAYRSSARRLRNCVRSVTSMSSSSACGLRLRTSRLRPSLTRRRQTTRPLTSSANSTPCRKTIPTGRRCRRRLTSAPAGNARPKASSRTPPRNYAAS